MAADTLPRVRRGDILGGRFEIDQLAAEGGMGQVFRGRDRESGTPVAVKMLLGEIGLHARRFDRESRALAELSHPRIVRYVAHGIAASGEPYLAMEWLDGEDLASRLRRGALAIEEAVEVASRVAEALGAAHARNVVHRDLKPSNVFLVGGSIDGVKLLDFGIARLREVTRVTRTGTIVGTPGYMAPEQIRCDRVVDARADVFALGCVLFECLTGRPAFAGEHVMALLVKVVFAEPPRLCGLRPDAPQALERLLLRMLAKDPHERPRDGAAVAEALVAMGSQLGAGTGKANEALSHRERGAISVVLLEGVPAGELGAAGDDVECTLDTGAAESLKALRSGAEVCGGQLEQLRDGSVVVSIRGAGLATDQAARAAHCALWLRNHAGGRPVALATGQGEITGSGLAAEAIDGAAGMLLARAPDGLFGGLGTGTGTGTGMGATSWGGDGLAAVVIDEITASLLDSRFDVREGQAGLTLHGEREIAGGARRVLGEPTTCVGRDRELSLLLQILHNCVEQSQAQAALVTGPPGIGKSRLAGEVLAGCRQWGVPFSLWSGRGDSLRAGSLLGPLGQALRGACGIQGDEPLPERRQKLSARVALRIDPAEQQRVAEFLGEITGVPFPDGGSERLDAARRDAERMTGEMRRAWVDFLRAECKAHPVLLVLEDLHWGDWSTLRFVGAALCELAHEPWMVLAMARPEVHEHFPKLWANRRIHEIQLTQLSKRASERLVRQVLGDGVRAETAERLIALADGNPFYLEELLRAAAAHGVERPPDAVIAMVQSRLSALEEEDRRVLRAAAVFGEVFWLGGVAALLGGEDQATHVQSRLLGLVEVVVRRPESRLPGEVEFAFRHPLLREGAYAMLTGDDRALGQRLAGDWLLHRGELNANVPVPPFKPA